MRIVDLMIIGAGRSGTSSVLRYLGHHPAIRAQVTPEITWFSDPAGVEGDPETLVPRYWEVPADDPTLRLGKAAGLMYDPAGLDRLRASSPSVQVAVVLREPVQRTYSGYWFGRARGLEPLESFEEAVWADPARFESSPAGRTLAYLDWSEYDKHISRLFEQFGRDAVHVLFLDEFIGDPRASVATLVRSYGLDEAELPPEPRRDNTAIRARTTRAAQLRKRRGPMRRLVPAGLRRAARSTYLRVNEKPVTLPPIEPQVEEDLRRWFAEPNSRLEQLLGRPLPASWTTTGRD